MVAVGRSGAEADLKLKDWSQCSAGQGCFKVSIPSRAMVGTNAGAFGAITGEYPGGGGGSFCVVFVFYEATSWHYMNVSCAQNTGYMPGPQDYITVPSGCANVRVAPSLSAKVLACLAKYIQVAVDSSPLYAEGHIWWHLAGRGWMVHDFLALASVG